MTKEKHIRNVRTMSKGDYIRKEKLAGSHIMGKKSNFHFSMYRNGSASDDIHDNSQHKIGDKENEFLPPDLICLGFVFMAYQSQDLL